MLEDGRCCEDVLTQLLAARSGLESASVLVLEKHLNDCVLNDDSVNAETLEKVRETLKLWSRHSVVNA
jgi:DNA-binding FrmR family transcriptional regulator